MTGNSNIATLLPEEGWHRRPPAAPGVRSSRAGQMALT
jgi:hypothetical protein